VQAFARAQAESAAAGGIDAMDEDELTANGSLPPCAADADRPCPP
jgi:hypothetical protein